MTAPDGFTKLPPGIRCRCLNLWQEEDGDYWCCKGIQIIRPSSVLVDADAERLKIAQRLYTQFCSDLLCDAGKARSRLIAGIQNAIRNEGEK